MPSAAVIADGPPSTRTSSLLRGTLVAASVTRPETVPPTCSETLATNYCPGSSLITAESSGSPQNWYVYPSLWASACGGMNSIS